MGRRVVAVVGWLAAAALRANSQFLQQAEKSGRVRPRDWRLGTERYRSLVLREDGSCELSRFTVATLARRLDRSVMGNRAERGTRKRG